MNKTTIITLFSVLTIFLSLSANISYADTTTGISLNPTMNNYQTTNLNASNIFSYIYNLIWNSLMKNYKKTKDKIYVD